MYLCILVFFKITFGRTVVLDTKMNYVKVLTKMAVHNPDKLTEWLTTQVIGLVNMAKFAIISFHYFMLNLLF